MDERGGEGSPRDERTQNGFLRMNVGMKSSSTTAGLLSQLLTAEGLAGVRTNEEGMNMIAFLLFGNKYYKLFFSDHMGRRF